MSCTSSILGTIFAGAACGAVFVACMALLFSYALELDDHEHGADN